MSMTIDFKDFNVQFNKIVKDAVPKTAGEGLFKAANEVLHDAIYKQPYAPFELGDLRGSARVDKVLIVATVISVLCGFNIEYAARWHELSPAEDKRIKWTLPGSGRKYLESKMAMYMKNYMEIVALHIKNSAR